MPERLIPVAVWTKVWVYSYLLVRLWVWILLGYECLSVTSVVCCQVEVSAMGQSPIQRRPTEYGVSKAGIRQGCFTYYSPASSVLSEQTGSELVMPIAHRNEKLGSQLLALYSSLNISEMNWRLLVLCHKLLVISITLSELTSGIVY